MTPLGCWASAPSSRQRDAANINIYHAWAGMALQAPSTTRVDLFSRSSAPSFGDDFGSAPLTYDWADVQTDLGSRTSGTMRYLSDVDLAANGVCVSPEPEYTDRHQIMNSTSCAPGTGTDRRSYAEL